MSSWKYITRVCALAFIGPLASCANGVVAETGETPEVARVLSQIGVAGAPATSYQAVSVSLDEGSTFDAAYDQYTKVGFRSVLHDDFGNWNRQTNQLVAPQTDYYQVCASLVTFAQDFELYLFVSDSLAVGLAKSNYGAAQGCRTVHLAKGQTLDLRVYQNSVPSGPLHFTPNQYWSWMTVDLVHFAVEAANWGVDFTAPALQFTKVLFNSASCGEPSNFHFDLTFDPSTSSRFVTSVGRDYRFCSSASSSTPGFETDLFIRGLRERALGADKHGAAGGCRTVTLSPNDFVEVWVWPGLSAVPFHPDKNWNWLSIDVPKEVFASLGNTAQFVVPSTQSGFTTVPFTTPLKAANYYDPATGRFTALSAGDYQFCASLFSGGTEFEMDLFINGYRENAFAVSHYGGATGCRPIRMNANDYVEVKVHQETGAPMTFYQNPYWNWLNVVTTGSIHLGG